MSIQGFEDWLNTPSGKYVLNWEQQKHDLLVADIFGFNAVQLSLARIDFLRSNRMPLRFRCDDGRHEHKLGDHPSRPAPGHRPDTLLLPEIDEDRIDEAIADRGHDYAWQPCGAAPGEPLREALMATGS